MFRSLLDFNKTRGACKGHNGLCRCKGPGKCTNNKCHCECSKTHGIKGSYGACAQPYHRR